MSLKSTLALAALALAAGTASAGTIPYSGSGQNPTTYSFTASATGDVIAYYAVVSGAAYTEDLGLLVNGVDTGIHGLSNHSTAVGTALDFGSVDAGDTLTFFIRVANTGHTYYSDPALNADGHVNHVYSTAWAGDALVPAGTYVGFEDLDGGGDFNYADEQFVFTNVSTSTPAVPEPANGALLAAGLGLMGWVARRRAR